MNTPKSKSQLNLCILEILNKYTDENHKLSQREIQALVEKDYLLKVDRKAIKSNLINLVDFGYTVEYTEHSSINKDGEEIIKYSDWYMDRDFTDAELRLLIDGLIFSKNISSSQKDRLIDKLMNLSSVYFTPGFKQIKSVQGDVQISRELFLNIEVLDEAIRENRKVEFNYNVYGTDKRLKLKSYRDGNPRKYVISPYQIVASMGKYYLISNYERHDNISHYRLDRITNIKILEEDRRPIKTVAGYEGGFNLPKHMAESLYMFHGEGGVVKFRAKKRVLDDLIDWFSDGIFYNQTEDEVDVEVDVNYEAMLYWAMQYNSSVRILSPDSLIEKLKEKLQEVLDSYE